MRRGKRSPWARARVLLTAAGASDLHFEAPLILRSTSHAVVAFSWRHIPVRVLLNPFNHLPDAVETTQVFHDFWYFWGDVRQRIYFDNWKLVEGITFPTNWVEERNGVVWRSLQALDVEFNVAIDEKSFEMNAGAVKQSAASPGWNRPFNVKQATALAPGIDSVRRFVERDHREGAGRDRHPRGADFRTRTLRVC